MAARTKPRNTMFPSTQHQIAAQIAALRMARNLIVPGMSAQDCRKVIEQQIAELEARLAVNAAAKHAVVPPYVGEGMPKVVGA